MAVLKKKKLENILNMCKSKAYSSPKTDKCYVWNRTYLQREIGKTITKIIKRLKTSFKITWQFFPLFLSLLAIFKFPKYSILNPGMTHMVIFAFGRYRIKKFNLLILEVPKESSNVLFLGLLKLLVSHVQEQIRNQVAYKLN